MGFSFVSHSKMQLHIQIVVKKEQSAKYDAGIAIDDVALIDCPLKRPTESDCPVDEWKCENQVCT